MGNGNAKQQTLNPKRTKGGKGGKGRGGRPGAPAADALYGEKRRTVGKGSTTDIIVRGVDLNINSNARKHRTDRFECTYDRTNEEGDPLKAQLVLRRGNAFDLTFTFDRPYDSRDVKLKLVLTYGDDPLVTRGTLVEFRLEEAGNQKRRTNEWDAKVETPRGNSLTMKVHIPATCIVGTWKCGLKCRSKDGQEAFLCSYPIIILFNPWCQEDACYMPKEAELDEYILNESGILYMGAPGSIHEKSWIYGQFEDGVLDAALCIMRSGFRLDESWGLADPVKVVRRISMVIKSCLVLWGRWPMGNHRKSNNYYARGSRPESWQGSSAILKKFFQTGQPVKYGQCWVFSGITTTVFRALGIPSRSVTNYLSGCETEGNNTIDVFKDMDGNDVTTKYTRDFVWNFHVWNEVWMKRPDLAEHRGMDGWQAVETTGFPQLEDDEEERFHGDHPCGPCPVRALKLGNCHINYDASFLFSGVNADEVYWIVDKAGKMSVSRIKESTVGHCISTKSPFSKERLDLTNEYKFEEGEREEREAVLFAHETARRRWPGVYDAPKYKKDVHINIDLNRGVMVGSDLNIRVSAENISGETKLLKSVILTVKSKTYNGNLGDTFCRKEIFKDTKINAGKDVSSAITIKSADYLRHLLEMAHVLVEVFAVIGGGGGSEPDQRVVKSRDFAFVMPPLNIVGPSTAYVGNSVEYEVSFTNPLKIPLTACSMSGESSGFMDVGDIKIPDIPAGGTVRHRLQFMVKRHETHSVLFKLDTEELDVNGETSIDVVAGQQGQQMVM